MSLPLELKQLGGGLRVALSRRVGRLFSVLAAILFHEAVLAGVVTRDPEISKSNSANPVFSPLGFPWGL